GGRVRPGGPRRAPRPPPAAPPDESDLVLAAAASFQQSIEPIGSVGEVLQSMVEAIRSVVGCDRCYGLLWHEPRGEFTPVAVSGIEPRLIGALKAIAFSPATVPALDRALSHPEPLLIADAAAGGQIPAELVETLGMRSAVIVPLRSQRNAVLAALMLDSVDPEHRFTALDLTILEQIAQHASVVVENALLYEAVKRSSDSLALVNEIGIDLASLTDVSRLVVQVYHHVASVIDAGRFCIGLLLPDGQTLEYWYAVDDYVADRPVIVALGDDPLSRVIRTRRRLLVNARQALDTSNWFPPLASLSPAESMLAVPLVVGHRVIGVLSVQSEFRGAYADHHLELLATIGMQTGVAIENARLYRMVQARGERRAYLLDQMLSRQEAERKTLVEDIHNDTLQTLASCLYRMDRMIRRVGQLTVEETQEELRQVRDELAENIARLRKVIFQLRPSTLDVLGFEAALKEYFKYLESETGIRASLDVEVDERPSSELETMIYRIVQEAVDNVRGRGGVTRVAVRVRQRSDKLVVTIADDGQQLDLATLDDTQPVQAISDAEMSLLTLKERAELAGGQMQVASRASGGATMQIILPYRSAS
ncbi:MAG: GAF domain-containing protein, partial [Thermomicrobiaceae bacterium]|nr:GAF domain-containing protein [Thermomicrobiaceae bacterium]